MRMQRFLLSFLAFCAVLGSAATALAGDLTLSAASGDAGSVSVGSTGTITFDVTNGPGSNQVTGVVPTGTDCGEFAITTPASFPHTIASNVTETWTITFTPTAGNRGARGPCTFTLADADADVDAFAASGTATQPNMVTPTTSLDFGDVHYGSSEQSTTITLTNPAPANEALDWTRAISGTDAGAFTVTPASGSLAVDGTQVFTITFTPTKRGAHSATLTISGDDASNPTDTVTLAGTGTGPIMTTSMTGTTFGSAHVGVQATTTQTLTITNDAGANEDLDWSIAISGAHAGDYDVSVPSGTLAPGNSTNVTVTFTPTGRGTRTATITVSGDDDDNGSDAFSVSGTGTSGNLVTTWTDAPGSLDFGSVAVNGGLAQRTVTVSNPSPGNEVLTINVDVTAGMGDYAEIDPVDVTLNVGESRIITVNFDPSAVGTRTGTLTVTSDDAFNTSDTVGLTGVGTTAIVSLSPSPLAFGGVHTNTSSNQTLVVDNAGTHDLTVTGMTITGTHANQFHFTDHGCTGQTCNTSFTVSPGADFENVVIRCTPTSRGDKTATLTVLGDQDSGTNTVTLTCTGTEPEVNVTPTTLSFGNVVVGQTSQLTFTVQNTFTGTGQEALDFSMAKGGSHPTSFTLSPTCATNCTVAAGGAQTVTVTFTPTARQAYSATVTITTDDIDEPTVTVTLTGTGIAPEIGNPMPATQSVAFGLVDVNATSTAQTVSIQNVGDSTLSISSVQLTGTGASQFMITSGPTGASTVAASSTASWQVVCAPTSIGVKSATLRINSDAINDTTYDFALSCTGQQATFAFSPGGGLSFGGVSVGTSSTLSVTISNTGNKTGTVQSITSGDATMTFNVVGGAPPRTVAAGTSITVDVTFTPVTGAVSATNLTVMTDGSPASFNIPVTGDGETQGVDISVENDNDLNVDLGDIRVNTTDVRRVTVQNTGDTAYTLQAPTSDDAHCTIQAISPASFPTVIAGGGQATFDVRATPTMLGAESCSITVTSTVPTTDTIAFSFVGVAPDVNLINPVNGVLDYAGVDVDAGAMTQTVQIQNTGDFPLTISGCTLTGSQRFALTSSCSNVVVAEGATASLDLTFDPTVEAIEEAVLNVAVDALSTSTVQVMLEGVGVDQNIQLPALSYTFPDTFRRPDDPPVEMVIVENPVNAVTGAGAPLTVSMAITDQNSAGVFVVEDAGPFTVEPDGSIGIPVSFRPTSYGPFTGTLTIMNDTTGREMAVVNLEGNGVSREVMVSPGIFDLGTTGVGVPLRLSELTDGGLVVQNIDPNNVAYRIRAFELRDENGAPVTDSPFRIITPDGELDLPAGSSERFEVEFVADEAGTYEVQVAVFLDGDTEAHATITLTARAVDVELKGGGCQAGRGAGAGTLALVVIGLALARQRRRAALGAALGIAAVAVAVAVAPGPAAADPTRNLELSTFTPAPATEVEGFAIESPTVGVDGAWSLGLAFSHATNVLRVVSPQVEGMTDVPVEARTALQLGFAYAFLGRFEAGLRLPFYQQSGQAPQFSGLQPADGGALGDVAAHVKAKLAAAGAIALAASLDVTAPTATDDQFAGFDGPTAQLRGIGGWRSRRAGVTVNAGFVARGTGTLADVSQGNALTYGGGAWFRALDSMWVIGEAFGAANLGDGGVQQLEGVVGVRYEVAPSVGVSIGVGRGLVDGIGAPDLRGFALVDVAPKARRAEPLVVKLPPPPRDTRDDDGDGVVNADDACPSDAEDPDGFADTDGCPDLDNDEDGLLDDGDGCPVEAEDLDGVEDQDGCVDPDNDKDGILDVDDKCPNEAEDKDGHLDNDGCDEPDNDKDGIPDVIDQCALEPETINGNQDDDGCPDVGDSLVMVMPDRIEIFEPIVFTGTTAKLSKKSANVLGQVAATLRANREFTRVRVTVHVHPRGAGDDELSNKRAEAVREWLLQWGIEPERIDAKGLGSSRPLVPKTQKGAAALNDRVEFIILEKEVK